MRRSEVLAYESTGSGEPLLMIHGIGHRRQAWHPVVDRLAEHHEVFLVDLPGHGESPAHVADGRSPRQALIDPLEEFLAAASLERPHVVGNSLGGVVALELSKHGLARSVTAISPAGFWRNDVEFAYVRALFASVIATSGVLRPVAPWLLRHPWGRTLGLSWLTARPAAIPADVAYEDLCNMLDSKQALRDIIRGGYLFDGAVPADVPITIAWGTKDRVLRPYQADQARVRLPGARHVELPGCGHVPMADDPDLIADTILATTLDMTNTDLRRTA
ncbi:alpha/beta fold hydrolase [Nocardioides sp. NPDC101246]|uniref:alpha/beta fold hydrolase n=1 Tax=Nocardioides sp. NPDC101246 TaxID=3364336 RepID=UPI0038131EB4